MLSWFKAKFVWSLDDALRARMRSDDALLQAKREFEEKLHLNLSDEAKTNFEVRVYAALHEKSGVKPTKTTREQLLDVRPPTWLPAYDIDAFYGHLDRKCTLGSDYSILHLLAPYRRQEIQALLDLCFMKQEWDGTGARFFEIRRGGADAEAWEAVRKWNERDIQTAIERNAAEAFPRYSTLRSRLIECGVMVPVPYEPATGMYE